MATGTTRHFFLILYMFIHVLVFVVGGGTCLKTVDLATCFDGDVAALLLCAPVQIFGTIIFIHGHYMSLCLISYLLSLL